MGSNVDVSGGRKLAKLAGGRPLDGEVRRRVRHDLSQHDYARSNVTGTPARTVLCISATASVTRRSSAI